MTRRPAANLLEHALLALAVTAFIACGGKSDWLSYRGRLGQGYTTTRIQPPLAIKWQLSLQYDENHSLAFNPPAIFDDTIYFGSDDGNFYALDIESGYMRWVFKTNGAINSVPSVDDEYVYFGSNDGFFYCVSREEGREVWSFDTNREVQSSTAIYEGKVIFTSDLGATYLFTREGVQLYNIPNRVWLFHTFQVYEDVMYFAPGPENPRVSLGAYDIDNRGYLWILDTAGDNANWYSFAALKGDYVYYSTAGAPRGGFDLTYLCLDRRTGEPIWDYVDATDLGNRVQIDPVDLYRRNLNLLDHLAPALWKNRVIYTSGDGCTYGEGGNHFVHAIRRNPDITVLAHNNMVYGLTKGQASPTTMRGVQTPVQVNGVILEPFNPIAVAVSLDASFVARASAGDRDETKEIVKKAIAHNGFALVDIFQPCVSFNRINTYQWFKEHTYYVDDVYDPSDRMAAFGKCLESDPWPLGVIYVNEKPSYNENVPIYQESQTPLYKRELDMTKLAVLIEGLRR